tara:strand:+ start:3736 stop:4944 length:1209 start_codon:yes stop_codon:yes gene_type:complete
MILPDIITPLMSAMQRRKEAPAPRKKFNIADHYVDNRIPYGTPGYPSVPQPLESLLPTGPGDLALETILSAVAQDNPKAGIILGLLGARYRPRAGGMLDNIVGGKISKMKYKKGFKELKEKDILHRETPSEFNLVPSKWDDDIPHGTYAPVQGYNVLSTKAQYGLSTSDIEDLMRKTRTHRDPSGKKIKFKMLDSPFTFPKYGLMELIRNPKIWKNKALESTVAHEGRHFLQHKAGQAKRFKAEVRPWEKQSAIMDKITPENYGQHQNMFDAIRRSEENNVLMKAYKNTIKKPRWLSNTETLESFPAFKQWYKNTTPDQRIEWDLRKAYEKAPIEIDARLEQLDVYGRNQGRVENIFKYFTSAGYDRDQVLDMLKLYKVQKNKAQLKAYKKGASNWQDYLDD